jgi:hypothetical protein
MVLFIKRKQLDLEIFKSESSLSRMNEAISLTLASPSSSSWRKRGRRGDVLRSQTQTESECKVSVSYTLMHSERERERINKVSEVSRSWFSPPLLLSFV